MSHTTSTGKAKCLNYTHGHRCARVAKHEVTFYNGRSYSHIVVCDSCLEELREQYEVTVNQSSKKGFTVHVAQFGPVSRTYKEIQ